MSNLEPIVSVLIPTYNQQGLIAKTIQSALDQDYKNFEIVISDDKSTDNTKEIIDFFIKKDPRVKYFCNINNLGRVGNYRKALYEYAKGEYVLNLDGDDLLIDKNFIKEGINLLLKHPTCNLLVGCKQYNYENKIVKVYHKVKPEIEYISGAHFVLNIFKNYEFSHLTTIYKREEAMKIGFYRENIISSDMESILRLALQKNVIIYNRIVGQWNCTANNESTNQKFDQAIDNLIWIKNVYNTLIKYTNKYSALKWRKRMKYIYSTPILFSIKNEKRISIKQINTLVKNSILILTIINLIKMCFGKDFR